MKKDNPETTSSSKKELDKDGTKQSLLEYSKGKVLEKRKSNKKKIKPVFLFFKKVPTFLSERLSEKKPKPDSKKLNSISSSILFFLNKSKKTLLLYKKLSFLAFS